MTTTSTRLPTYFISHGGGPWPWLDGPFRATFDKLEQSLFAIRRELAEVPRAVLVVTGHWEEDGFAVSSGESPGMVYDYYGFPEHTYHIRYAAPGSPALAARVAQLLEGGGVPVRLDPERGYDHGTFSLMKPLYPEERMPLVQLSIDRRYDPARHLEIGKLLAPLRDEGVLIIGSGLTYHNLREMRGTGGQVPSRLFDDWLQHALVGSSPAEREQQLLEWEKAPMARAAHPQEDHLVPLMVAVGAAWDEPAETVYYQNDLMGVITASSFRFGAAPAALQTKG